MEVVVLVVMAVVQVVDLEASSSPRVNLSILTLDLTTASMVPLGPEALVPDTQLLEDPVLEVDLEAVLVVDLEAVLVVDSEVELGADSEVVLEADSEVVLEADSEVVLEVVSEVVQVVEFMVEVSAVAVLVEVSVVAMSSPRPVVVDSVVGLPAVAMVPPTASEHV